MAGRRIVAGLLLALAAGCARQAEPETFVPDPADARQAVAAALEAWKKGQPPGTVEGSSPRVQLVDGQRKPGQKLLEYQILGNDHGKGPITFLVRVTLDDPPEEQKVRFVVFGIDPLWVMRQEDYDMLARWECAGGNDPNKAASER